MVDGISLHRADQADFVGDFLSVWKKVGEPDSGFAALFSTGHGLKDGESFLARGHTGDALIATDFIGEFFAVIFLQRRFTVKKIDVGWASGLEEVDDTFCLGRVVRSSETGR